MSEMAAVAELAGQGYLGTQALGTVVPGQQAATPRVLVIVAVDRWENSVVLRGTATVDRKQRKNGRFSRDLRSKPARKRFRNRARSLQ